LSTELTRAAASCRRALIAVGLASILVNMLYLTGSFYMLEIYDRVVPSRSIPTLIGLSMLAVLLYSFQGLFDLLRNRVLIRVSRRLAQKLSPRVYHTIGQLALRSHGDTAQPLRDLDQIKNFLSGAGPIALLDLPWIPFYIAVCFAFHVWLGVAALIGAIVLISLMIVSEVLTRRPTKVATAYGIHRTAIIESSRRNAEVLRAMGMTPELRSRWLDINGVFFDASQRTSDVSGGLGAVSKTLRMVLQSSMLGVGAVLVIYQEATAGIIIAGSILAGRALAPVDLAIANWRGFVGARQSWHRLGELFQNIPQESALMSLPRPVASLTVEGVSVVPPNATRAAVQDVSLRLERGAGLGIVGPSASGKSSLARALVGVWRPVRGTIRIDGAAIDQWSPEALGQHIGYLPQDVELFAGTVAQNIARLQERPDANKVIAAANAAGVHELILRLPKGYETEIGNNGAALSAGQRQRIALARALYGDPFLVVLDEPNSNLDASGDEALTKAVHSVRARGGIVIVIAHRPSALAAVDTILMMKEGRTQMIGPKNEAARPVLVAGGAK
jgi:ATP-binding cassette subfamily C protein PrsD